ncbi:uncharacterized protein [Euphorbia lathyris]|uniref:uncharacterized protein isoform X1 n=1 Tax=Euphorbia lathyris TaxID=212925 RepID=UPI003313FE59
MATNIVPELLEGPNYKEWRVCMKAYLLANDLWEIVKGTDASPNPQQAEDHELKAWRKKNAAALHAIQISTSLRHLSYITTITSAKLCWDVLANIPGIKVDMMFEQQSQTAKKGSGPQVQEHENAEGKRIFQELRKAIERGDIDEVKSLVEIHKDAIIQNKVIDDFDSTTLLHIATSRVNLKITEMLLEILPKENLEIVDYANQTALFLAAGNGATKIVECLVKKNDKLVGIPNKANDLPLDVACSIGHKETAHYLYNVTPFQLLLQQNGTHGSSVTTASINAGIFDITLHLLRRCPSLAISLDTFENTPLSKLCSTSDLFPSGNHFVFWKQWIYSRINVKLPSSSHDVQMSIPHENKHMQHSNMMVKGLYQLKQLGSKFLELIGLKEIYDSKLRHAYALEILSCMCEHISTLHDKELIRNRVPQAFFTAIVHGEIEVVIALIKANPILLTAADYKGNNIIMIAIQHRQEKIFSLVYALGVRKYVFMSTENSDGNGMLHLAAQLAPPNRLDSISGAALQMQRELQWYKEVESIINPSSREERNKFGMRPQDIFSESHAQLVEGGEKWMKETATSSTVVGALIITIMFTAAFTVPGGNVQETGYPIFLQDKLFKVFIISDAVSLFASSTSVLMFLGVLTSRYAEEDFLKSLPRKLIIGLSTLFISIAAMMVAFCAALIIMLRGELQLVIPIVLVASIPVTLFILLQFPLLVEIFVSTYMSHIFNRKMKFWY